MATRYDKRERIYQRHHQRRVNQELAPRPGPRIHGTGPRAGEAGPSSARTWPGPRAAIATVVVMLVLVVELDPLHTFFTTTDLTSGQWLACAAVSSTILWVFELVKLVLRTRARRHVTRREQ